MKLILLMAMLGAGAAAQGLTDVPPILQVIRKPGTGGNGTLRPYNGAKAAVDVVGMTAMTGLPETWGIELHQTFAGIEDLDLALNSTPVRGSTYVEPTQEDLLAPTRTMILLYQPGWSYRPQEAVRRMPRAHYFHISIYRMRTGAESDLGELMRLRRHEMDSVNLDRPDLVYRVVSGAPSGTYVILAPMISLRAMDDGVAKLPIYAEPLAAAEAAAGKTAASQELSREHFLFRVEPRQSYVSAEFSTADPEFWRDKQR
ncbi:MAG TPA: hypothetical protein VG456_20425 [Candidatus Sulfopaludibacter sp.]|jgi:hypothetical protein|nr:hypothetical protein [Candidatus Sulfopaludibacter sp.]